jgi:hypothetical protein
MVLRGRLKRSRRAAVPLLRVHIPTPAENHRDYRWLREEALRFYVGQRRQHCTYLQLLDLWMQTPMCSDCKASDPLFWGGPPDIGREWEEDILWALGEERLATIRARLGEDPDYAITCYKCGRSVCPWDGDDLWVHTYHLEEHFGLPLETPGRRNPSKEVRKRIVDLYDRKCFNCGAGGRLHLDHIRPRAKGGDSAFRNLQPLCVRCGQQKGNSEPEEIGVYDDRYFDDPPSDSHEGLFW